MRLKMKNEIENNTDINEIIENEIKNIESGEFETGVSKRKRGRPKGSKNKKQIEETETDTQANFHLPISLLVDLIFSRLNLTLLNEVEKSSLDNAFDLVLNKYINEIKFKEEINFAIILLIILTSRYSEYKNKDKDKTEKDNAGEG
jgi:hypothetical protein